MSDAFDHLDTVWCETTNMKRSAEFYRDLLGLRVAYESDSWTSFDLGSGVKLGLHAAAQPEERRPGFVVGFVTQDIRALRSKLEAAGAKVEQGYHDIPRGVVMDLCDPDGNRLQATQLGIKSCDLG